MEVYLGTLRSEERMIEFVLLDIDDTLLDFGKAEAAALSRTFS